MTESMASEPAEPTTRQATNPRVGMFARVDAAIDAFVAEHGEDVLKLGPRTAARIAITTLDEAGLLADPAQTTELERLRRDNSAMRRVRDDVDELLIAALGPHAEPGGGGWYADVSQLIAERDEARAELERTVRERDSLARRCAVRFESEQRLEGQRDALSLLLRGMARKLVATRVERDVLLPRLAELAEQAGKLRTTEWLRTCATLPVSEWPPAPAYKGPMVPAADMDLALWLHAEAAWRVAGFDVLTVALARRNHQLTAERDERQARIEAATAELKKWDAVATRESEWMPCRAALAALVGDQGKHLGENQAELGGPKALTSGNSWANRDLDLSGAALRAVEEADHAAGDLP